MCSDPFYPAPNEMKRQGLLWTSQLTPEATMVTRVEFEPQRSCKSTNEAIILAKQLERPRLSFTNQEKRV